MTTDDPKKQAQQQQQEYLQEKDCSPPIESFRVVASAVDGAGHSIAITSEGWVYTWGRTNGLGQLGRPGKARTLGAAQFADPNENEDDHSKTTRKNVKVKATRAFAGGTSDAGHSAVIDSDGHVWLTGCDRWQQLGLGSSSGGASGYTWKNGALWQERFQKNHFLPDLMRRHACDSTGRNNTMSSSNSDNGTHHRTLIRDMALGGDHTLVLSSNQRDVFAFGNGGDGQLGLKTGKPFVSAPVRSPHLSSKASDPNTRPIAAVCAIRHCSLTLDQHGNVLEKAGKCRHLANGFAVALASCQDRAEREGLIKMSKEKE
jgi:alpha-tubulin suppressor-like RCC1 family protein